MSVRGEVSLSGGRTAAVIGDTTVTPVTWLAAGLMLHDACGGLDDQRVLSMMLGLDEPPPDPAPVRGPRVQVNTFRRHTRGKGR